VTLDHLSGGRAVLGIGGAWFEREHEAFGIDFGSGFGERLDRLDESVSLLRRLLDGERIADHQGAAYAMHDALAEPRPVQRRLPIMIGGSGPKKTLRTLARYGDQWNTSAATIDELKAKDDVLRERCAEIGRDPASIEKTITVDLVIRDTRAAALEAYRTITAGSGQETDEAWATHVGEPARIAESLRPVIDLGFRHVLVDTPAPYDAETIDRIGEVLAHLRDA
jgi:alkanesulfonate monooxygenase SsuD/methylene tetrahydromethanopterin reductase-like flavin-dependent oxidoreductase (luciferase family)